MSLSKVSLCNQALAKVGVNPIVSFDDESEQARICTLFYEDTRDAVIGECEWTFARRRFTLAPLATPPAFGYGQAFLIPTDVEKVISVSTDPNVMNNITWEVEGDQILCDATSINVMGMTNTDAITKFSKAFAAALISRLAAEFAVPITRDVKLANTYWTEYGVKVDIAMTQDGQQGTQRRTDSGGLVQVRYTNGASSPYIGPQV